MSSCVIRVISLAVSVILALFSALLEDMEEPGLVETPVAAVLPAETAPRVISVLQSRDELRQHLKQAADIYSQSAGMRFSVQTVANQSDYQVALKVKMLSDDMPDIFHVFGYRDMSEMAGHFEDLSGMDWVHGAAAGLLEPATFGESVFGIPYSVEGMGLIVNFDIFSKADVYLNGIVTLGQLEEAFRQLQEKIFSGALSEDYPELEAVTEFAANDKAYVGSVMSAVLLSGEFGSPQAAAAKYIDMPGSESAKELIRLMALYSSCSKWEQLNSVTQIRQLEDGLASGRVAAVLQSTEAYRRIKAANPDTADNLLLLPLPVMREGEPDAVVYVSAPAYWAVNASAPDSVKDEAKGFLEWLYTSGEGAGIVTGKFGIASPYRAAARDTEAGVYKQLLGYAGDGRFLPHMQNEYPREWLSGIVVSGLREYFSLDTNWDGYIRRCKEDWHNERLALTSA